jgi:hypothetical protein
MKSETVVETLLGQLAERDRSQLARLCADRLPLRLDDLRAILTETEPPKPRPRLGPGACPRDPLATMGYRRCPPRCRRLACHRILAAEPR